MKVGKLVASGALVVAGMMVVFGTTAAATTAPDGLSAIQSEESATSQSDADTDDGCRSDYERDLRHANHHWQSDMGQAQNLEDVGSATGHLGDEAVGGTGNFISCVVE